MGPNNYRGEIAKATSGVAATVCFSEHALPCNVDNADASKDQLFAIVVLDT